ncbi:MAG: glycoside hydrolase family 43 protein [Bacillota bacterium]
MKNLLFLMSIAFSIHASAAKGGGFLFTTFRDETTPMSEQIYMAISEDGRQWKALKDGNPMLVSDVGEKGVRDSFLLRSHDGKKVWLIATDLCVNRNRDWHRNTHAGSRSIVVWESSDLVHWSPPRLALVAAEDAGCAWAPEAIYDEEAGDYLVYWASTTRSDNFSKQRIWAARTKDFRTFDKPFVYVERPNHVIDINIVRDGDTYYRFTKDDKEKSVSMASSKKLMGPWQEVQQFTAGKGKNFEGPICFQLKPVTDGQPPEWCLLLDNVSDRIGHGAFGYMPFVSHDLSTGQFTRATDFRFPYPLRHGSVLPITAAELERLKSAYRDPQKPATPASAR